VSIDEEMTNLVKHQHAYSASAKVISVVNEMLDTLVNRTI
jgi:flagellar hook-associated protein 1 FlgK